MQTVITLGDGRSVTIAQYVTAVKQAKAHPDGSFKRSLRSGWGSFTGHEIMHEFYADMVTDHCNRGLSLPASRPAEFYLVRRLKHGKLTRECRWCGARFDPATINDRCCSAACQRDYRA